MKDKLRIVFMGTPAFAVPILKALLSREDEVIAVVTQPDKPAGRGKKLTPPPVKLVAQEAGVPVLQPVKIKSPDFLEKLRELSPDVIVVAAYGKILPKEVLEIPRFGCINVHASLLPKFRGAAPINWAIIAGEKETGITIMQMDEGMDTGDILLMEKIPILPQDTAGTLHDRLAQLGAKLINEALDKLKKGELVPQKQPEEGVSYAPILRKEDGLIDFNRPAKELTNLIRGLDPWPTAYAYFRGRLVKFFSPEADEQKEGPPGEILGTSEGKLLIGTGKGLLKVGELQLEGKKRITAEEFWRGYRPKPGEKFESKN
ncbi:methionyl-tRNA formyltransferase [Thermodesulfatator autotrophicus]|uniref:Methionyl-tRNA formyltransferase n=1 Tax=Thermodesulfatator autotrophicus TaxID=1795632 RepID=A0A177E963_9BACT|nr:methionyl-tRNA formyltransferase [Thermodesulfatator autotrophicus]OAG27752.1 methionyl-tRNA formyltransferase [Thermodesulfatator autotrophicus]